MKKEFSLEKKNMFYGEQQELKEKRKKNNGKQTKLNFEDEQTS